MKIIAFILGAAFSLSSCNNDEAKMNRVANDTANYTSIHWIDSVENIGFVNAGTKKEIRFRFKNTGTKPLFIIAARPGCGCTVANYPKQAIASDAEGVLTAEYDVQKGSEGSFRKNISVAANTRGTTNHTIFFYGEIKK